MVPWNFCRDFGGGLLTSNTVHAFDVVQWALGMDQSGPVEIVPPEAGPYPDLTFKYPGNVLVHVVDKRLDHRKHAVPKGWDELTSIENFGACVRRPARMAPRRPQRLPHVESPRN